MNYLAILQFVGISLITADVHGYNILIWSAFGAKSHKNVLDPIAEELGKRGHQVIHVTCIKDETKFANVTDVYISEAQDVMSNKRLNFFQGDAVDLMSFVDTAVKDQIKVLYRNSYVKDIIDQPRDTQTSVPKFDLVIMDATFNEPGLPIAYLMQVPVVYVSTTILFTHLAWNLNVPFPVSYAPTGMAFLPKTLSFQQRAMNAFQVLAYNRLMFSKIYPGWDKVIKEYIPNVPPLQDMQKKASFVITNDHPTIGPSLPSMPYIARLGGFHCKPVTKKLPEDLEKFMESSGEHGVIFFSLGSFTRGRDMPSEMQQKLLSTFAKLPQNVLWKNEKPFEGHSQNIKFTSWAPQQELLAHPKLRLFITHGGMLSSQEAAYHGCPILGFPLSVDQLGNIGNAVNLGYGELLIWKEFTAEDLLKKINLLVNDKRYKENAMKVSAQFKDRPQPPVETAAYWIEYVIRHKGAPHLRSAADDLNFFQYFLLDVIGALVLAIGIILSVAALLIRLLFKLVCRSSSKTSKLKKQ